MSFQFGLTFAFYFKVVIVCKIATNIMKIYQSTTYKCYDCMWNKTNMYWFGKIALNICINQFKNMLHSCHKIKI
jgi:hypothetical protein